ncbi:uncharacterized protein LOC130715374 [Lotus japonicus]|uniref:uncharacterized protein LOC130715374 n=1 Tax=Lotus japonicus TaxID=34305 RepID=UPI00258A06B9|nr:uncharacterized protein LOC130715374 [Lotus japonicus]
MATNSVQGKRDLAEQQEEDEEEEEALSLCDLPVTMVNHNNNNQVQPRKQENPHHVKEEEFDFRGLFSKEPEIMCVADEVFFQGQILPFRHSFSTEAGLLKSHGNIKLCKARSESLGHGYGSSINSSRSSSVRSQNSSSSTSSTTTTTINPRISKPRFQNQFHTHPSPKPQLNLKSSGPRQTSFGRKSSVWEIFRLGVVPAPEIELQDLKVRSSKNCVSRNSSNSSSNSDKLGSKTDATTKSNHFFKQLVGKSGGLLSGCDCSIETVVQFDSNMAMIKSGGTKSTYSKKESATTTHAVKEKVGMELKKQKQRKKQGKKVMSRRRTFEWLKELHANHLDDDDDEEEALLS